MLCATAAIALPAQTLTTLFSFDNKDGESPETALIQATGGNLYGTTLFGGAHGDGAVFKITLDGTGTLLYSFCARSECPDGQDPSASLVQAANGDFYGTTYYGGAYGDGAVFKITPAGTLTRLYSFCAQSACADGDGPYAALVQGIDGNLYGTTQRGGAHADGTVFKITPSGTLTTLYSFCAQTACADGNGPQAPLIQATDGDFYGTTVTGGANPGLTGFGAGTVFKITPAGTLTTLYSFCAQTGCTDGAYLASGVVQATDGNFYGTTEDGGATGYGTVYSLTPAGILTTLYSFCSLSGCADGELPIAGVVEATDGNLYGSTSEGGTNSSSGGTLFKITPAGALTTLYDFCALSKCADGKDPQGGLLQDTNGILYGTTVDAGTMTARAGTVFSLSVGLGPFVRAQPNSGRVGAAVTILGTSLTGATAVSFNGTAAVFKVVSRSEITTTVPAGASSGTVQVITPGGTLSSNVPFHVLP